MDNISARRFQVARFCRTVTIINLSIWVRSLYFFLVQSVFHSCEKSLNAVLKVIRAFPLGSAILAHYLDASTCQRQNLLEDCGFPNLFHLRMQYPLLGDLSAAADPAAECCISVKTFLLTYGQVIREL